MQRKTAGFLFLAICILLAVLLLTGTISSITSGCVFAVALVILGGLSRGFKRKLKRKN
jgi:Flp pilus assembly protein TadB